ncbi:MAG: fibronectin type III domain-containing protein, partial [Actinomycetota bacterium]|nr:fibronectin type III domain-containing protein [Actinomycetota bacterium]
VVVDTVAYDGSGDTAVSTSLSGLSGGVSYDYVVAARSSAGEGARSTALSVSTSPPAPGSVASVSQTTSSITLSWSAPVVTTGSAVTGYNVYINDGSNADPSTVVSCGGDALSTTCTASGLTGGVSYRFQVSALSTTGESDRSSVLTQLTAPAEVVANSMTFDSITMTSMVLTWSAPSGTAATGYIVYRDDGDDQTPSIVAFEGAALTATVSGLAGGTSYNYMVAALSEAGVGDVSGVSRQSTSPASPLGLSSDTQTSTSITLSWSASVVSGGSAVTSYKVYANDGSSVAAALSQSAVATTDGSTTVATVSQLSPGLLYSFAVSAVSDAGEGEQSTVLAQSTSPGVPASGPTSVHQTSTSISLDWSAPSSDGSSGEDASGYRLYDVAGQNAVLLYDGPDTAYEQVGLTAGTSYSYAVSAVSAAGESPSTSTLVQSTAPAAPTGLSSSGWSTSGFDVSWSAPSGGGPAVTGYTLYERVTYEMADVGSTGGVPDAALQQMLTQSTDAVVVDTVAYDGSGDTALSTSLTGLSGGVRYDYVVAARSSAG